jgi:hypothetical protein
MLDTRVVLAIQIALVIASVVEWVVIIVCRVLATSIVGSVDMRVLNIGGSVSLVL